MNRFDVQVVGAGIVGQALALSLGRLGLEVALLATRPASARVDVRAFALSPASAALLRGLKVWDALPKAAATPVYDMIVQGDAHGSEISFSAWQQRIGELAWITDAAVLERELATAVRFSPHITRVEADAPATLTALCEAGLESRRAAFDAGFVRHEYGDRAIAARLRADEPHQGTARQWFRAPDVLALLPFDAPEPERSYALVWSLPAERAEALMALDVAAFEGALAAATGNAAGTLTLASERAAWPLELGRAERWGGPGWVLVGEAAHTVHPLAGQGLNLGLADVAALAGVLTEREPWRGVGDERLLRRYVRLRAAPTRAMAQVTDGLLRLFSHDSQSLRELRNRGLDLVNHLPPVKRWLTSQALGS